MKRFDNVHEADAVYQEERRRALESGDHEIVAAIDLQVALQKPWLEWVQTYGNTPELLLKGFPYTMGSMLAELISNCVKRDAPDDARKKILKHILVSATQVAIDMIDGLDKYACEVPLKRPTRN